MPGLYALDDAAAAALWGLRREPTEHMGALYEKDGALARSNIITSQSDSGVDGKLRIGGELRALFHNHPPSVGDKGYVESRFSDDDKAQAKRLHVPSYITTADGRVFVYDPWNRRNGEEVLAQIPLDEIRKRYLVEGLKK